MKNSDLKIDIHLDEADLFENMKREIRLGLQSTPKSIPPKFFYDKTGSLLFEQITEQPEYYQTRTERKLLERIAPEIERKYDFHELLELGSGSSAKTRVLLDEMSSAGSLELYLPFDVSRTMIQRTADELIDEYPTMSLHGIIGDFTRHLRKIPPGQHRLIIFLGGTIGNLDPLAAKGFLSDLASTMSETDRLLLGTDLVKDISVLEAAYNDKAGITADFNRNVLHVINQQLDANFNPETFEHVSYFNAEKSQIEMWLRSTERAEVTVPTIDLEIDIAKGEEIHTEISRKFTRTSAGNLLAGAGLEMTDWFTDPDSLFGLSMSRAV